MDISQNIGLQGYWQLTVNQQSQCHCSIHETLEKYIFTEDIFIHFNILVYMIIYEQKFSQATLVISRRSISFIIDLTR